MTQQIKWLTTQEMATHLRVHKTTLLDLRRLTKTFREGRDFRRAGLSKRGTIQWHPIKAEEAFSNSKRIPVASVETFAGVNQ